MRDPQRRAGHGCGSASSHRCTRSLARALARRRSSSASPNRSRHAAPAPRRRDSSLCSAPPHPRQRANWTASESPSVNRSKRRIGSTLPPNTSPEIVGELRGPAFHGRQSGLARIPAVDGRPRARTANANCRCARIDASDSSARPVQWLIRSPLPFRREEQRRASDGHGGATSGAGQ